MDECLFCRIASGALPVKAVYEDEFCLVFADVNPQAPTHLLVIPKEHYADVTKAPAEVLGSLLKVAAEVGERELPDGFRVVINTGADGGQTVQHLHLHLLGGRAMTWPPG